MRNERVSHGATRINRYIGGRVAYLFILIFSIASLYSSHAKAADYCHLKSLGGTHYYTISGDTVAEVCDAWVWQEGDGRHAVQGPGMSCYIPGVTDLFPVVCECVAPEVLNPSTNTCQSPQPECSSPNIVDPITNQCRPKTCNDIPPFAGCIPYNRACNDAGRGTGSFTSGTLTCTATILCQPDRYVDENTGAYLSCGNIIPGDTSGSGSGGGNNPPGNFTFDPPPADPNNPSDDPPDRDSYCSSHPDAWICKDQNPMNEFCRENPKAALCRETNDLEDYCEKNPNAAMCKGDFCTANPNAQICKDKNPIDDFCTQKPNASICKETAPGGESDTNPISAFCTENPTASICQPSTNPVSQFCAANPQSLLCRTDGSGVGLSKGDAIDATAGGISKFCQQNPTSNLCRTDGLTVDQLRANTTAAIRDYCTQYPNTEFCRDRSAQTGEATGACASPPTCTGDAIQCAALRQSWETMCAVKALGAGDGTGGDGKSVGGLGCGPEPPECKGSLYECAIIKQQWLSRCDTQDLTGTELGSALDGTDEKSAAKQKEGQDLINLDLSQRIDTSGFLTRSCPADQTFQVLDVSVTLPFSEICFALQIMGQVAFAAAMLVALRIVFV